MIGVDVWCDASAMMQHYSELTGYEAAYAGKPTHSVWEQAKGGWSEW